MKTALRLMLFWFTLMHVALASGSIDWEEVKSRISKTDPLLVKVIERTFSVSPGGSAVRLGPQFGERQGERIAPYRFFAKNRKTGEELVLVIEESDDFEYTGRFKFTWEWPKKSDASAQPGSARPATKPGDKVPVKVEPSSPGSKESPR